MTIIPVILSGGSGTRLWPLSRSTYPKQLISLVTDFTMIQETVKRLSGLEVSSPIVVCNEQHRFIIAEQLSQIGIKNPSIVLEPVAKNTAPAIVAAAIQAKKIDENAVIIVLPSDHNIQNSQAFCEAVNAAAMEAMSGSLVTFGINPTFPATGYGYIESSINKSTGIGEIKRFVEKPDLETAKTYLSSGNFFWNSGMFVFKASAFLDEINVFEPEMLKNTQASFDSAVVDLDFIRLEKDSFSKNKSISIDYAVMEKTAKGKVVPLDAGWSDVGSWNSLWDVSEKDENGNVLKGNAVTDGVKNSFIYSKNRTVSAIGLENVVIVDTKDAVLVADRSKSEDVKNIVDVLKLQKNPVATESNVGYRPWGTYETIELGARYRVKHIVVKPGQKLSVQMHYHRAEHWIIVSGTAKVLNGDKELILSENQSTFIPLGTIHAIENPGKQPLEFIEVQSGSYLEEDDIVRFEDKYGRC
ncbi:MAG: mannose-1-phosphate guanylyltransferase/mannose-6-phosphate isomerase [Treponema sp.]|nr:mannose-1-phosphate guanylyltransferase/mannose-6-phosphate isomerase [Candidatus Treponema equifaecale]